MLVPLTTTEHGHSDLEIGHSQHTTRKLLGEAIADTLIHIVPIIGYDTDRGHGRWQAAIEQERSTRLRQKRSSCRVVKGCRSPRRKFPCNCTHSWASPMSQRRRVETPGPV